jgi:hypothetical protein
MFDESNYTGPQPALYRDGYDEGRAGAGRPDTVGKTLEENAAWQQGYEAGWQDRVEAGEA